MMLDENGISSVELSYDNDDDGVIQLKHVLHNCVMRALKGSCC